MKAITVTASTLGQANPANVTLSKPYRWRGIPGWVPGDTRYREPGPASFSAGGTAARQARRRQRLRDFAAALEDLGATCATATAADVIEAGRQVGVAPKTARRYRSELKQQGEAS